MSLNEEKNYRRNDFSPCHHQEVGEDVSWEVLHIVANQVVVEGCVDPNCDNTNQAFEVLWALVDNDEISKTRGFLGFEVFL